MTNESLEVVSENTNEPQVSMQCLVHSIQFSFHSYHKVFFANMMRINDIEFVYMY